MGMSSTKYGHHLPSMAKVLSTTQSSTPHSIPLFISTAPTYFRSLYILKTALVNYSAKSVEFDC